MPTFLSLGGFLFSNLEIPERVTFGGEQTLSIHQLVGGKRIIDAMGRSDTTISWEGQFRGFTGLDRARFLDSLRVAGNPLVLTFSVFRYNVLIKSFVCQFQRNGFVIPYSLTLEVIEDLTLPFTFEVPDTINTALQDALIELLAIEELIENPSFSNSLAALAGIFNQVGDFSGATQAEINAALAAIASTQGVVGNVLAAANSSLFG